MITFLSLRNFQLHYKKEVELGQITTLVGKTESGKTAVLRALKWLATNTPLGTAFIRNGAEDCIVEAIVDNHTLTRGIGQGINFYKLDKKTYKSFNRDVPEDIAKLLNVSSVNFQDQLSLPYFFCLTPGQVGRELNSVIDLEVIDTVVAAVASESRKAKAQVEFTASRLQKAQEERDRLRWVKDACTDLQNLEHVQNDMAQIRSRIDSVALCLKDMARLIERAEIVSIASVDAASLVELEEEIAERRETIQKLEEIVTNVHQGETQCQSLNVQLVSVEREIHLLTKDQCPVCGRKWQ